MTDLAPSSIDHPIFRDRHPLRLDRDDGQAGAGPAGRAEHLGQLDKLPALGGTERGLTQHVHGLAADTVEPTTAGLDGTAFGDQGEDPPAPVEADGQG